MANSKELHAQSEIENISQGLGTVLKVLHESNFPVLARNLRPENSNISGIHVERGGVPRKVVVLHAWGPTEQEPESRLVVIGVGDSADDLRSLSIQTRDSEHESSETKRYLIGQSVDIGEFTQESKLSNLRKWVRRTLLGEIMQQDHLHDISSSISVLNATYPENPLTSQKLASIAEKAKV